MPSNIYITAGHGGTDPGAIGNGLKEADLTLELRDLIISKIKNKKVYSDANTDPLAKVLNWLRSKISINDLIIDIHFNAGVASANGTEVLIPAKSSTFEKELALKLSNTISTTLNIKNRGVKTELDSARGKIGILNINCENILIEVCFISNINDITKYQKNKEILATNIAKIIDELA
jgi:N-acetylmuramoyl-L-alanine amidase